MNLDHESLKNLTPEEIDIAGQFQNINGFLSVYEGVGLKRAARLALDMDSEGEIVEIGTFCGRSTIWIASECKKSKLHVSCIDHFIGSEEHKVNGKNVSTINEFWQNMINLDLYDSIITLASTSDKISKIWKAPIKMLFIDGDHSYEGVKKDFELYSPFVVRGGLICFHDVGIFEDGKLKNEYGWIGPTTIYNEIIKDGKYEIVLGDTEGISLRVIRIK